MSPDMQLKILALLADIDQRLKAMEESESELDQLTAIQGGTIACCVMLCLFLVDQRIIDRDAIRASLEIAIRDRAINDNAILPLRLLLDAITDEDPAELLN
jgi:hypothetical protein